MATGRREGEGLKECHYKHEISKPILTTEKEQTCDAENPEKRTKLESHGGGE